MQIVKNLMRWWRRASTAGVDMIFDYEVAALQAILHRVADGDRTKLVQQLARYDRIDRAPNRRKQIFIDDDSDSPPSDWPKEILFPVGPTEHVATVRLQNSELPKATIRTKAFFVWGIFSGFEFDFDKTHGIKFDSHLMNAVMPDVEQKKTKWQAMSVELLGSLRSQSDS